MTTHTPIPDAELDQMELCNKTRPLSIIHGARLIKDLREAREALENVVATTMGIRADYENVSPPAPAHLSDIERLAKEALPAPTTEKE